MITIAIRLFATTVVAALVVYSGVAQAQSPTQSGYGSTPVDIPNNPGGGPGASLPYTGINITLVALAGLILLAVGLALHRHTNSRTD
jgi:LPXTG-motif cell wall-anchored protein